MKKRTDVPGLTDQVVIALATLNRKVGEDPECFAALAILETFTAVGLEVIAGTKPDKVRRIATRVELRSLL